jgi:hypothetical protein
VILNPQLIPKNNISKVHINDISKVHASVDIRKNDISEIHAAVNILIKMIFQKSMLQ